MCKTLVAVALLATGVVSQTLNDEGKALRGGGRNTLFGGHSDTSYCTLPSEADGYDLCMQGYCNSAAGWAAYCGGRYPTSLEECAAHCDSSPGCFAFSWGVPGEFDHGSCYLVTNAIFDICTDLSNCKGECFSNPNDGSAIVESCDDFNLAYTDAIHQCYCRTAGPSN